MKLFLKVSKICNFSIICLSEAQSKLYCCHCPWHKNALPENGRSGANSSCGSVKVFPAPGHIVEHLEKIATKFLTTLSLVHNSL